MVYLELQQGSTVLGTGTVQAGSAVNSAQVEPTKNASKSRIL